MDDEFITLTPENLADEHLCCIIRSKKRHPGVEAKRAWLAGRLMEGHGFGMVADAPMTKWIWQGIALSFRREFKISSSKPLYTTL